jgi:hypothetical protein
MTRWVIPASSRTAGEEAQSSARRRPPPPRLRRLEAVKLIDELPEFTYYRQLFGL